MATEFIVFAVSRALRRGVQSGRADSDMPSEPRPVASAAALRAALQQRVRRYCPAWMQDEVDDLVQIAWMRLDETLKKNEGNRTDAAHYVGRLAYCVTVDEIRRRRRRHEVPVEGLEYTLSSEAVDPQRALGAREIGDAIEACLKRLLPRRRSAVAVYLQGHSLRDTGALLGWTAKRAENMVFRGLADLRRCLAGKGIKP